MIGTQNLYGGTETRRKFLGHLPLSKPNILNLEILGILSYKDLSCAVSFTFS